MRTSSGLRSQRTATIGLTEAGVPNAQLFHAVATSLRVKPCTVACEGTRPGTAGLSRFQSGSPAATSGGAFDVPRNTTAQITSADVLIDRMIHPLSDRGFR